MNTLKYNFPMFPNGLKEQRHVLCQQQLYQKSKEEMEETKMNRV